MINKRSIKKLSIRNKNKRDEDLSDSQGQYDSDQDNNNGLMKNLQQRKLSKRPTGINSNKLISGESNDKRDNVNDESIGWNSKDGGLVDNLSKLKNADNPNEKLVKINNFTGQSNAIDVDKHMMSYIETEMRKKRKTNDDNSGIKSGSSITRKDPNDELYAVAQRFSKNTSDIMDEGSVTTSSSMLTQIPEVDLGIESKLRNIEQTEKAKRKLMDEHQKTFDNSSHSPSNDDYNALRFQQPKMAKNRIDSNSLEPLKQQDAINDYRQSGQSNDLRTYENFKQKRKY